MPLLRVAVIALMGLGWYEGAYAAESLEVRKTGDGQVQVVIVAPKADAIHTRVMLDTDESRATGFGDEGADLMIEGATLYAYPKGATGWNWDSLGPVPNAVEGGRLVYTLALPEQPRILRLFVESFNDNWEVTDRFPAEGAVSVDTSRLGSVPQVSGSASLSGNLYRTPTGGLAVAVLGQGLDPNRLRAFINTDGNASTGLAPAGADYMIEGLTLYKHTGSGTGWDWTPLGQLTPDIREAGVLYQIEAVDYGDVIEYRIEKTDTNWEVIDRYPGTGMKKTKRSELKEYSYQGPDRQVGPKNYSLDELMAFAPSSLNAGFDRLMDGLDWTSAPLAAPAWKAKGFDEALPLVFTLQDAQTGATVALTPASQSVSGEWTRWAGEAGGVHWSVFSRLDENADMDIYTRLKSSGERLLRLGVGVKIPAADWVWHDDVEYREPVSSGRAEYAHTGASPYGMDGAVSKYPLGVISADDRALVLETDLSEPVVFKISARPAQGVFGIHYDVALTPLTLKFPNEAVTHLTLRARDVPEQQAFRQALGELYTRNPALFERRPAEVGLWMPFTDISKIRDPQDFGFAYYEKGGAIGADVDFCHDNGVLTLVYTEPWLYWLPMPQGMERTPQTALALMKRLAAGGTGKAAEFASGGLLGAARSPEGDIVMTFQDVPWNSGGRMEVSTDPELPTAPGASVNRAMAEFAFMREQMDHEKVDGIYLDSLSAMFIMDYNPEALAVADYPATFTADVLKPGLATPIAAYEFIAALAGYAESKGKYLMGNFPCWNFPFFMPLIDIPGEETHWFSKGRYERMSDRDLNYRRAMSGQKAWGFLMNGEYDHFEPQFARSYFEDCLFWAFQPSLFSHDAANDPYWENAEWYERDRPWFQRYMPWIQRLAAVGWQPTGIASTSEPEIQVEHFYGEGEPVIFITARNSGASTVSSYLDVQLPRDSGEWLWTNPLDGEAGWLFTDAGGAGTVPVMLEPGQVRVFALVPGGDIAAEIGFLENWRDGEGDAARLISKLRSLQKEQKAGLLVGLEASPPLLRGVENELWLEMKNASASQIEVTALALKLADGGALNLSKTPLTISAGNSSGMTVVVPADFECSDFVLEATFTVNGSSTPHTLSQPFAWTLRDPASVVLLDKRILSVQEEASIPLRVRNLLDEPAQLLIEWSGDYGKGQSDISLAAKEERKVYLPVVSNGKPQGSVSLRAQTRGLDVFMAEVEVTFLGKQASVVRDSSVSVSTSGDFPGYSAQVLRDGVTAAAEGMAFNEAAWASEDAPGERWVRFDFSAPREVSEVKIYWNREGGVIYTSQSGIIEGVRPDGSVYELTSYSPEPESEVTTVSFDPASLVGLVVRQPARQGPSARPDILWLNEVEVR
ncbi:hypothetical protein H5P28_02720 [Ruficoccus amylovorans]|uniref:F5/8 type C domain-containing protein n=1 Tax=Ruficoccus amylovorans TaxID=1804625 RepID=A0A842HA31_9BACT|nr:hypothetical protein [Ruficoccus amylovorans]MBC2593165.1 hypothetical protein [Ruficoccus amylovorans]